MKIRIISFCLFFGLLISCSKTSQKEQTTSLKTKMNGPEVPGDDGIEPVPTGDEDMCTHTYVKTINWGNGYYGTIIECAGGKDKRFPDLTNVIFPKDLTTTADDCNTQYDIENSQLYKEGKQIIEASLDNYNSFTLQAVPGNYSIWDMLGLSETKLKFLDNLFSTAIAGCIEAKLNKECTILTETWHNNMIDFFPLATIDYNSPDPGNFLGKDWDNDGYISSLQNFVADPSKNYEPFFGTSSKSVKINGLGPNPKLPRYYFYFFIPEDQLQNYFN